MTQTWFDSIVTIKSDSIGLILVPANHTSLPNHKTSEHTVQLIMKDGLYFNFSIRCDMSPNDKAEHEIQNERLLSNTVSSLNTRTQ